MNEFRLITHPLRNLAELDAQLYTEKSAYLRSRPEPKPGIGTYTKFRTLPPSRHDGVNRVCLVRKSDFLVSILLFLVRKSDFLVSILLFLVSKSDFLVSILLFLVSKSDFLASISLFLVSKSDSLASILLFLVRKSDFLASGITEPEGMSPRRVPTVG